MTPRSAAAAAVVPAVVPRRPTKRIHAPVLHDALQIAYCRYCGRASLPPITSNYTRVLRLRPPAQCSSGAQNLGIISGCRGGHWNDLLAAVSADLFDVL